MIQVDFPEVRNNADFPMAFTYQDNATPPNPIDLTGSTLSMMVYDQQDATNVLLVIDSGSGGITVTNAAQGKFQINLPASKLGNLRPGVYKHDLIQIKGDGSRPSIWEGSITIVAGPTRP